MYGKLTLTFLLSFTTLFLSAQISDDYDWIFDDLKALEGTWFRPTDKGDFLEKWKVVDDSTMVGEGFRIKLENTSDTVRTEYLELKERGGEVYYSAKVRRLNNGQPVEYILSEAEGYTFTFESTEVDYPKKIDYVLLDRREIIVRKSGIRSSTGKAKNEELQFTREFKAASAGFRIFAGTNYSALKGSGAIGTNPVPTFGGGVGWDAGVQYVIEGRGGFVSVPIEMRLSGFSNSTKTDFYAIPVDTAINFVRDAKYVQTWIGFAVLPTLNIIREGKLSVFAGPSYSRLLVNRAKGTVLPEEDPTFKTSDDLKKTNFAIAGGFNLGINKNIGGHLTVMGKLGLTDLDNLYKKVIGEGPSTSGNINQWSIHLNYSVDLLQL